MDCLGQVILVWISDLYIARDDLQLSEQASATREGDAHESCGQSTSDSQ